MLQPSAPSDETIALLDADPELAALVPGPQREAARGRAVARVQRLEDGPWTFQPLRHPAAFGMLVLEGLVGARVAIGSEAHIEVVGTSDLLRPWVHIGPGASVPSDVDWRVFSSTTVAMLDEHFALAVAPWPQIAAALMHRLVLRSRRLSFQLALAGINRTDERLLIALWHFADRWGHVTPEGVTLKLELTQGQLGEVIRVARPSVSSAINDLRRAGVIAYERSTCTWTLHGDPPQQAATLKRRLALD